MVIHYLAGEACVGTGACPGNASYEVGIHPEWDDSPLQGSIHAHIHSL